MYTVFDPTGDPVFETTSMSDVGAYLKAVILRDGEDACRAHTVTVNEQVWTGDYLVVIATGRTSVATSAVITERPVYVL